MIRPDFAEHVRLRIENPRPYDEWSTEALASVMGRAALRQLGPSEESAGPELRMSSLGKCARQLAYQRRGEPENGRRIDARTRTAFAVGDMVEIFLATALRQSLRDIGGWRLEETSRDVGQQMEVSLRIGEQWIRGHPDGLLVGDGQRVVLEIKSASSYAFSEWQQCLNRGEEPWTSSESYYWQLQAYIWGASADAAYVIAMCKDSNAIIGWWHAKDHNYIRNLETHLVRTALDIPPRMRPDGSEIAPVVDLHKRTGRPNKAHGTLPWECKYCSYYRTCWADRLIEGVCIDYRGRPSTELKLRGEIHDNATG